MKTFPVLAMLFIALFLTTNLIAQKLISCGYLVITAGDLVFPLMYLVSVLITEIHGYNNSRIVIWSAFGCNLMVSLIIGLAIYLPYDSILWNHQKEFSLILAKTPRILLASFIAFLIGEFICARSLVKFNFFSLKIRSLIATFGGHFIDSTIFSFIAFLGDISFLALLRLIFSTFLIKITVQSLLLPLTPHLINTLKKIEKKFSDKV